MAITITEKAADQVKRLLTAQQEKQGPDKLHLRMRVIGGGCSGFQHKLNFDATIDPTADQVFDFDGVPVVVDKRSLVYLDGVTVDYSDDFNGRGFRVSNPNAKSTCGCGSSFSM